MFSLIITLIAIVLVAALALATLYYGGPVFNEGAERALAAKLDAQGQQIMGALELYNAELGHYPAVLEDLVSTNYLKAIPTAAAEQAVMAAAYAASGTWSLSSPGQPVIVMKPISLATCQAFNKANLGVAGVLQQAHSTKLKQCVGTDVNNLMIIQPKSAADLVYVSTDPAAVVQIGPVLASPVPTASDVSSNGWLDVSSGVTPPVTPPAVFGFTNDNTGLSVSAVSFGSVEVGTSQTFNLAVTNAGTGAITFQNTAAQVSAPYSISYSGCDGATLIPGDYCYVDVDFAPAVTGDFSGAAYSLSLKLSGATTSSSLLLTGQGVAPALPAYGATVHIDGPAVMLPWSTYPVTVSVTNTGATTIDAVVNNLGSVANGSFNSQLPICAALAPNATCMNTIDVTSFDPGTLSFDLDVVATIYDSQDNPVTKEFGTGGHYQAQVQAPLTSVTLTYLGNVVGSDSTDATPYIDLGDSGGAGSISFSVTNSGTTYLVGIDFDYDTGFGCLSDFYPGKTCVITKSRQWTYAGDSSWFIYFDDGASGMQHQLNVHFN